MTPNTQTIASNLQALSTEELARLAAQIADAIAARNMQEAIVSDVLTSATKTQRKARRRETSAEWFETKEVNGHQYRYRRWWENGKKRSEYIGKA